MGTFNVQLEIGDPEGERYETVEAMVDSGAAYTFMPQSLLRKLGVQPYRRMAFVLADGTRIERDFGHTWIKLNGELGPSPIVFGDDDVTPLLGAVTLEIFALGIDPVNEQLIPVNPPMGTQLPKH